MAITLSVASEKKLVGVHPALIKVVWELVTITTIDFLINEGVRTVAAQKLNLAKGVSQTMRSRHIPGVNKCHMSCAVDLVPFNVKGKPEFSDWKVYYLFAPLVKKAAARVNVPIEWGGDWKTLKDGPHFQLPASFEPYA